MALLTKNFNQVARKMNKRLKGTYLTKNINFSPNPSTAPFKGNKFSGVNTEATNNSKGIQCRECEGYGHIQAECAKTRKKNKSYIMTWSDKETEEQMEPFNEVKVLVSLATLEDSLEDVPANVVSSLWAVSKSSDDEEISDEEPVHSYKVMYKRLVKALNENQDL